MNALYLQAAVEELPHELDGIADRLHINFPWGSLLKGVATGDDLVLKNLRRLCKPGARLEVIIVVDPERDQSELKRLELPELSAKYLKSELALRYESNGFEVVDCARLSSSNWPEIKSTWAKRLQHNDTRILIYLQGRAK